MRAMAFRAWVTAAAVVALASCSPHPVGPARSFSKYEGKAVTTAQSALSSVQTVRLAAQTGGSGDAFGPYLTRTVSDQEDAITGVQGTFGSIQPPDTTASKLRTELDQLLSTALDEVTDVRIVLRRGQFGRVEATAQPLEKTASQLQDFIESHK